GAALDGVSLAWEEERDEAAVSLADRIAPMLGEPVPDAAAAYADPPLAPAWPRWSATAGAGTADSVGALVAWAAARGAELDAVEIRTSPAGNRTVHARRQLLRQERVLFIPRAALLVDEDLE